MFRVLSLVIVLVYVCSSYGVDQYGDNSALATILDYVFNHDGLGTYNFGFTTSNGIQRLEEGVIENPNTEHASSVVRGSYSYPGADGKMVKVKYTADKNGFHPEGDNINVPQHVVSDTNENQRELDQQVNQNLQSPAGSQQRFNRQYATETNNFDDNYHQTLFHPENRENVDFRPQQYGKYVESNFDTGFATRQQAVNNDNFNYDKSILELLASANQQNSNYDQHVSSGKPIIAILGEDGKLVDSNFDNVNIPDSILELLGRSNVDNNKYNLSPEPINHPKKMSQVQENTTVSLLEMLGATKDNESKISEKSNATSTHVELASDKEQIENSNTIKSGSIKS